MPLKLVIKGALKNILPNPRSHGIKQNVVLKELLKLVLGHFNGYNGPHGFYYFYIDRTWF